MQYVSWKQGDPLVGGKDEQAIKPKTWTNLKFGKNGEVINPDINAFAQIATYINVKDAGGARSVSVRFIRDPKGKADFTGEVSFDLALGHKFSHTWFLMAKKGTPLAVQVYHEGSKNMMIGTREFKAAIGA
jgi:hypothetical protein